MVDHILERGHVKPLRYFLDLGLNSTELLTILDIYKAIPDNLIHESASDKLQKVDLINFDIELEILGQKMNLRDVHSKKIYNYFVNNLQNSCSLQIKDVQSNFGYTEEEIKNIFLRPRSTTLIGKHREFQYMLLHGVLYTKEHLSRFGFVGNNLCSYCNQETETYKHVFLQCPIIKDIWKEMILYYDLTEIQNMEWADIFVGLSGSSVRIKFVNSLIILLKYVIFKSRNTGILPSFNAIQKQLLEYMNQEKKLQLQGENWGCI